MLLYSSATGKRIFNVKKYRLCYRLKRCIRLGVTVILFEPAERGDVCLRRKTVFILHGHTRGVKHGAEELLCAAKEKCADIVLYGHTHIPKSEYIDNMYVMCPGSIRDGSYGIVDITDNGILCYTADLSREL